MEKVIDTTGMKKLDGQMLKRNFGLNSTDYEGVMYYSSESSAAARCRGSPDDLCQKEQSGHGAGDRCGRTAGAGGQKDSEGCLPRAGETFGRGTDQCPWELYFLCSIFKGI